MEKVNKNVNQITEGVIWKQLLVFFFPIAVGTMFQQLYNTADAMIVGRFLGKEALASVGGSAAMLTGLVIGFFTGLSSGAAVVVSQFYGAEDEKNLHDSLHTAYAFSVIVSIIVAVLGYVFTPQMLAAMKTPAELMGDSVLYLRIYFLGMLPVLIFNMGSGIMRAIGDSKRPLYYLIVCCFLNIGLDLLFVVVFKMGVAGAAFATILSQLASAILVTVALMYSYDHVRLHLREIRATASILKHELKIGLPSGLQACMYSFTNLIIQSAINNLGTDTTAAWAAFGKIDAIYWTICTALGISITTFAGQNYGAKRLDRVFKSVRVGLVLSFTLGGGILLFLVMNCRFLFGFFTTDLNVIDIGVRMFITLAPSYIIYVFVEVYSGGLRGMGDVLIPTIITIAGVCCVRIPWILIVFPLRPTINVIMLSYPLAYASTALFMVPYYFYRKKKMEQHFI